MRYTWPVFLSLIFFYSCEQQPYQMGERIYKANCANCHMDNGEGLAGLIPPLAGSDYLPQKRDQLVCIVRYGLQDTIVVNGKIYAEQMVGNENLSDIQITNVVNYILQRWGKNQAPYTFEETQKKLGTCKH